MHDGSQTALLSEVRRSQDMREVVVRMRCIERSDQVCKGPPRGDLAQGSKWRSARQVDLVHWVDRVSSSAVSISLTASSIVTSCPIRRTEGRRKPYKRFILRFEAVLNVLVQLLIASSGFRSVDVASSDDVTVGGREVQRIRDGIDIAKW